MPIENSLEGSVNATLDALAIETEDVTIVGEVVHPIRQCLIARSDARALEIETVVSHPQATAQCARFIRTRLPHAPACCAAAQPPTPCGWSPSTTARGRRSATASLPSATAAWCCAQASRTSPGNETRFVWLAGAGAAPGPRRCRPDAPAGPGRRAIVFWGIGSEAPGWLVSCLAEFATRDVNLTRIESRPRKQGLGRYMFFVDLEGASTSPHVREALEACAATSRCCACSVRFPASEWVTTGAGRWPTRWAQSLAVAAGTLAPAMATTVPAPLWSASPSEHQRRGRESGRVLVLNATYEPINVCTVRRAVVLLLKDKAEVIEHGEWELHSATSSCRGRS